ncbi:MULTISPECIES: hypothetical protein [unclassified Pantoea]|uniref:hypothetical protein n=1 Tax=unclassified Pantoea TaxID=2630326 RepID=UPI00136E681B|nr:MULTISPECIES: hypothetical protein [unclassified Pantoea]
MTNKADARRITGKKEGQYRYRPVKEEFVYDFGYHQHCWRGPIFAQSSEFRQYYSPKLK